MADLHRQLQEYLAQGKAGGQAAAEPLLAEPGDGPAGAWLAAAGLRWTWSRSSAESAAAGPVPTVCLPSVSAGSGWQRAGCLLSRCSGRWARRWPGGRRAAAWAAPRAGALLRCEEAPSRPALLRSTLLTVLGARARRWPRCWPAWRALALAAATRLRLALGRLGRGAGLSKALPV
uniref:Uncharacterized protein n=1 Tax=Aotus nancymaae TaxID=37293 RepID=A0A2K5C5N4_AOTNA